MTTELEHYQPTTSLQPAVASALPAGAANLRAWAAVFTDAADMAAALVDTPFVPDSYRPRVDPRASLEQVQAAREIAIGTAAAAIVYGAGIGFDNPIMALQNVYVVKGRPALYANAMVAIVQSAGHEFWVEDLTDARAVVCGRRRGGHEERVVMTMDMAKRAGWASRNDNYAKDPQAMLYARAASRLCQRIAQAELKGFGASVEELLDGDEDALVDAQLPPRTVTRGELAASTPTPAPGAPAEEKPKATRPRKKAAAPAERPTGEAGRPPLPGEAAPAPAAPAAAVKPAGDPPLPGEGPARPSQDQMTAMDKGFTDLGLAGQDRRAYVARVIGREVAHPGELTAADVAAVIDELLGPPADAPGDDPDPGTDDPEDDGDGSAEDPDPSQESSG